MADQEKYGSISRKFNGYETLFRNLGELNAIHPIYQQAENIWTILTRIFEKQGSQIIEEDLQNYSISRIREPVSELKTNISIVTFFSEASEIFIKVDNLSILKKVYFESKIQKFIEKFENLTENSYEEGALQFSRFLYRETSYLSLTLKELNLKKGSLEEVSFQKFSEDIFKEITLSLRKFILPDNFFKIQSQVWKGIEKGDISMSLAYKNIDLAVQNLQKITNKKWENLSENPCLLTPFMDKTQTKNTLEVLSEPLTRISEAIINSKFKAIESLSDIGKKDDDLEDRFSGIDTINIYKSLESCWEMLVKYGCGSRQKLWISLFQKSSKFFTSKYTILLNNFYKTFFLGRKWDNYTEGDLQMAFSFARKETTVLDFVTSLKNSSSEKDDFEVFKVKQRLFVSFFEILIQKYSDLTLFIYKTKQLLGKEALKILEGPDSLSPSSQSTPNQKIFMASPLLLIFLDQGSQKGEDYTKFQQRFDTLEEEFSSKLLIIQTRFRQQLNSIFLRETREVFLKCKEGFVGKESPPISSSILKLLQLFNQHIYKIDEVLKEKEDDEELKAAFYDRRCLDLGSKKLEYLANPKDFKLVDFWKQEQILCTLNMAGNLLAQESLDEEGKLNEKVVSNMEDLRDLFSKYLS